MHHNDIVLQMFAWITLNMIWYGINNAYISHIYENCILLVLITYISGGI